MSGKTRVRNNKNQKKTLKRFNVASKAANMVKSLTSMKNYCITHAQETPDYLRDVFIHHGYRSNFAHWKLCLKSVFMWHNETLNIWTHLIGFLIFSALTINAHWGLDNQLYNKTTKVDFVTVHCNDLSSLNIIPNLETIQQKIQGEWEKLHHLDPYINEFEIGVKHLKDQVLSTIEGAQNSFCEVQKKLVNMHEKYQEKNGHITLESLEEILVSMGNEVRKHIPQWPILVFLFSAMCCFFGSTLFHTFSCHSRSAFSFFVRVDYSGISCLIAGSLVPFVFYIFYEFSYLRTIYLWSLVALALLVIWVTLDLRFSARAYKPFRAGLFVCMAAYSFVPLGHFLYLLNGQLSRDQILTFSKGLFSGGLYLVAVSVYLLRYPEKRWPGKCDHVHSHQVFHVLIVAAALVWYDFAISLFHLAH